MAETIQFQELEEEQIVVLLQAHGYEVDDEGFILDGHGDKIQSSEIPSRDLKVEDAALVSGSLKVMDGSPTAISKLIREGPESVR